MRYLQASALKPLRMHLPTRTTAMIAAATVFLAGCSASPSFIDLSSSPQQVVELPELSAAQTLREATAASEEAISTRSAQMGRAATACSECLTHLDAAATASTSRLAAVGGSWDPWGTFSDRVDAAEYVELPAEVTPAPFTVGGLTAFMMETAQTELLLTADVDGLTSAERAALASVLVGRIGSASALAAYYGVDLEEVESANDVVSSGDVDAVEVPGPTSPAATTAGEALVILGCARTGVLSHASSLGVKDAKKVADSLNARMNDLVALGAQDRGHIRCSSASGTLGEVFDGLLHADLVLIGSDSHELRTLGAHYTAIDARWWAIYDPTTVPTVSLLPLDEVDDVPQS